MKILFFSHYFPPEVNAPATRTYEHCLRWVREGHDVTVVTCAPNCPDGVVFQGYRNRLRSQLENVEGIRVVRVWTYLAANAGFVKRILNYLSYMLSGVMAGLWISRPDVVVATSPQFFCGWAGVVLSKLKRVPFVLEIRDIWPESIEAVGAMKSRRIIRFLEFLERRMYKAADSIVTVGTGYRDNILQKVAVEHRISVITNGVDFHRFSSQEPDERFLHIWNLEGKFVCSYIGTIGMAHGLEVVLKAGQILKEKGRDDIRFCLVGDGAARSQLEESAKTLQLDDTVIFTGRLPRESIPGILAASDACLIHLKGCELFSTVIPSKIFETMAMGRPVIMGVKGESREIVMEAEAGLEMEPDSPESLVECVERLADDPFLTAQLGNSARDFVARHYNRNELALEYLDLLQATSNREPVIPKTGVARGTQPAEVEMPVTSTEVN